MKRRFASYIHISPVVERKDTSLSFAIRVSSRFKKDSNDFRISGKHMVKRCLSRIHSTLIRISPSLEKTSHAIRIANVRKSRQNRRTVFIILRIRISSVRQ